MVRFGRWLCGVALTMLSPWLMAEPVSFIQAIDRISLSDRPWFSAITGATSLPLQRPTAITAQGNLVYFFDEGLKGVYIYNRAMDTTVLLPDIYDKLSANPNAMYLNEFLDLFVLDPFGKKVLRFDNRGQLIMRYSDALNLNSPQGLCINPLDQHVFVADGLYGHIIEFGVGGQPLAIHKVPDADRGQAGYRFIGMACDQHHIYALSAVVAEILVFSFEGELVKRIDRRSVREPGSIAIDQYGRLYVTDKYDDRIKIFGRRGYEGAIGSVSAGIISFRELSSIWIDGVFLYVADTGNRRIQTLLINP